MAVGLAALLLIAVVVSHWTSPAGHRPPPRWAPPAAAPTASAAPVPPARRPSADLPVVDYGPAPRGFPADPQPLSTAPLTVGLSLRTRVPAYDAPGGRPRAYLPPHILGAPLTLPVVQRRTGWTAVLLPSVNRRLAWLPPRRSGWWIQVPLRDQLVVVRRTHQLTWLRDGTPVRSWKVSLGLPRTPTPLGRTFVLGRSAVARSGYVYGGVDGFALGAVPDRPERVPAGLRGAHIGIHTWHHDGELGADTTDGCIRLTRSGQRSLLAEVRPGTPVVVLERAPAPPPRPCRPPDGCPNGSRRGRPRRGSRRPTGWSTATRRRPAAAARAARSWPVAARPRAPATSRRAPGRAAPPPRPASSAGPRGRPPGPPP